MIDLDGVCLCVWNRVCIRASFVLAPSNSHFTNRYIFVRVAALKESTLRSTLQQARNTCVSVSIISVTSPGVVSQFHTFHAPWHLLSSIHSIFASSFTVNSMYCMNLFNSAPPMTCDMPSKLDPSADPVVTCAKV